MDQEVFPPRHIQMRRQYDRHHYARHLSQPELDRRDERAGVQGLGRYRRTGRRRLIESEACAMKLYLARWEFADIGREIHGWFTSSPEAAATWAYRAVAGRHRRDFNRHGVILQSQGAMRTPS